MLNLNCIEIKNFTILSMLIYKVQTHLHTCARAATDLTSESKIYILLFIQCLGNHEFDLGVEDLRMFVHNVSVPVVSSNLDMSGEPLLADEPNLTKSKVLTVNGRRIGIIGYLTPETAVSCVPINPASLDRTQNIKHSVICILC